MDKQRRRDIWLGVGLVVMTVGAFLPILWNGFVWDDDFHIVWNGDLREWSGVVVIWTRPLSMPQFYPVYHTLLWVGYRLWGLAPAGYHAMSLGLQCVNVVLLWRLLVRFKVKGAWFAAGLWAVHPVLVETVGWAMEVKSELSGTFYFLALMMLLPLWGLADTRKAKLETRNENRKRYLVGALLFLLSLLSKSVTATMPAVILLLVWWKRGRITWGEVWRSVPLFLMGILAGGFTAVLERSRIGAEGPEWDWSFAERVLIASRAFWMYVGDLVWPRNLNFFYYRWRVDSGDWGQWVWVVGVVVVVGILWGMRKRIGRGWLTGFLFFGGTVFPALGFSNVYPMRYSFVADHFQYLACVGIFVMAGAGMWWVRARWRGVGTVIGLGVLVTLGVMTFERCFVFRDEMTLYSDIVAKDWRIWAGQNLLASEYHKRGENRVGAEHAAYSVWVSEGKDLDCREMLSMCLGGMGEDALGAEALRVNGKTEAGRAEVRGYLGRVFAMLGKKEEAERVSRGER